jgi:hypothetical protein
MIGSVRFEGDKFLFDGYPEGSVVRGFDGPGVQELNRLLLFRRDL